jgi:hypothetical protein
LEVGRGDVRENEELGFDGAATFVVTVLVARDNEGTAEEETRPGDVGKVILDVDEVEDKGEDLDVLGEVIAFCIPLAFCMSLFQTILQVCTLSEAGRVSQSQRPSRTTVKPFTVALLC